MNELDRFAVIRLNRMIERVIEAYEAYDFHVVYQAIHHFCAVEMSSFYLDIVKDRLYVSAPNDPAAQSGADGDLRCPSGDYETDRADFAAYGG